ncbi:hypothetical protein GF374_03300 [Candidatus Woesearchaeota archaeon]|nr:hypothetical protein [Candidatus Woesearchaeota archaeon]
MEKILVDTNIWIYGVKNSVDIQQLIKKKFGLAGIYTPNVVLKELKQISEKAEKGTDRKAARVALQIIRDKKIPEPQLSGFADSAITKWAVEEKGSVLTNDFELKNKLKKVKVKVYCLRQGKLIKEW